MSKDEALEAESAKLTAEVDATLKLSKEHTEIENNNLDDSTDNESSTTETVTVKHQDGTSSTTSPLSSGLPTRSEAGWKEPPSTPATKEFTQNKDSGQYSSSAATVATKAAESKVIDPTLPQSRPNV